MDHHNLGQKFKFCSKTLKTESYVNSKSIQISTKNAISLITSKLTFSKKMWFWEFLNRLFKIQPTAQCIIYCWSFGHFTCYEMSMSRSTYIMIIKLFVCECTKDDDREVAALMSTRLWNFHIYVIICLFVQGLDCSIASLQRVLIRHKSFDWSEPTFSEPRTPSTIIVMY